MPFPFQTQTQTCCPTYSGERHPPNSCYAPYVLVSSAWFAFFLPCYATFKVLSHRPINEAELQKHAMYWSVIGAVVAFEYIAEWLISWQVLTIDYSVRHTSQTIPSSCRLPFYWEVKTLFFLYLSLPQIQVWLILTCSQGLIFWPLSGFYLYLFDLPSAILSSKRKRT